MKVDRTQFMQDGFIILRNVVPPEDLERVRSAVEHMVERRREISILRTVGARPGHIFSLLVLEAGLITAAGALLGLTMLYLGLLAAQPLVVAEYGLTLSLGLPSARDLSILSLIALAGVISGTIPAARAYRQSLSDGMVARL